ncbi:hypothetical protein KOR34_28400 [Posidoniimonas corsicana]|uniref:Uncharacterized protein n=2 Tax=Posidoniimonas corsicana TaxID=1938618 RepID=A0A5C5VGT3_9BACT|nr:hypothetical protein KOR34_28400 [Posidoniimonas corsicana]
MLRKSPPTAATEPDVSDEANPYASPSATDVAPPGERALATEFPSEMRRVRTGLSLVYYGICGILLLALGMPVVAVVLGGGGSQPEALGVVMTAMPLLMLGFAVLMFVGEVMCTFVPRESGAKGLALAAVGLQVVNWLATLGGLLVGIALTGVVGGLASLASLICFVLFLRQTSLYIGREDVARRAVRALVVGLVSLALLAPMVVLGATVVSPGATGGDPPLALSFMAGVGGLGMLAAFLMYANTITYLRKAITL